MRIMELALKYEIPTRKIDYWTQQGLVRYETDEQNGYRIYDSKSEEDIQRNIIVELMKINSNERDDYLKMFDILPVSAIESLYGEALDNERDRVMRIFDRADDYLTCLKERKTIGER